jgi:hypothetical protein
MTLLSPAHMTVVKKEEKETKLRAFLTEAIDNLNANGEQAVLRVLARCTGSPAVRAVAAMSAELDKAGIETRLMLSMVDQPASALPIGAGVRHMSDIRCLDAHELLVIGTRASWVGDCMRRDPSSRDSFELHAIDNATAAKSATTSFDRLWSRAAVLKPAAVVETVMEMAADLAALPVEQTAPQVLTRH